MRESFRAKLTGLAEIPVANITSKCGKRKLQQLWLKYLYFANFTNTYNNKKIMLGLPPFNPEGIRKDLCKLGALKLKLQKLHGKSASGSN